MGVDGEKSNVHRVVFCKDITKGQEIVLNGIDAMNHVMNVLGGDQEIKRILLTNM